MPFVIEDSCQSQESWAARFRSAMHAVNISNAAAWLRSPVEIEDCFSGVVAARCVEIPNMIYARVYLARVYLADQSVGMPMLGSMKRATLEHLDSPIRPCHVV